LNGNINKRKEFQIEIERNFILDFILLISIPFAELIKFGNLFTYLFSIFLIIIIMSRVIKNLVEEEKEKIN